MGVVDINLNCKFMGSLLYVCCFMNFDQVEKFGIEFNVSCILYSNWSFSGILVYIWVQDQLVNELLVEISLLAGIIGLCYECVYWWV